jgi:Na+-driven multidrug efflux pump
MLQGLIGAFGVRIPVAYIMSRQAIVNVFHVGLATPASTLVQITMCGIYFLMLKKQHEKINS